MRTMYDAIDASLIPVDAQVVAGYVTGRYTWSKEDWARFPHAVKLRIDATGGQPFLSDVADVERYDLTPEGGAAWAKKRQDTHGWWSAIYASRSSWPAVQKECKAIGATKVCWWIADWTNEVHLIAGTVATQYENTGGYDLSVIADHWFPRSAPGWSIP